MMHTFWNKCKCTLQELGRSVFVLIPLTAGIAVVFVLGMIGKRRRQMKREDDTADSAAATGFRLLPDHEQRLSRDDGAYAFF